MLINPEALQHWLSNFYGYGSWQAPVWFVSHEENGGDLPDEVAEKLNYFSKEHPSVAQPTLCNIRELYKHVAFPYDGPKADLFTSLYEFRFGSKAVQDTIFRNLTSFVHGYSNKELPDLLTYQQNTFVSSAKSNEALIRLYPLPAPHSHSWYYGWLELPSEFSFIKTRTQYQDHVYEARMKNILKNIGEYKPSVVLMYGMTNINALKKSIQDFFQSAKFRMVPSTRLQIPQHHRADFNGTAMLITTQIPALRHNRVETGFDWEEFGKLVKSES
jgi:hypothetical protein